MFGIPCPARRRVRSPNRRQLGNGVGGQLLHRLGNCRERLPGQTRFEEQVSMCGPEITDPHKHFVSTRVSSVHLAIQTVGVHVRATAPSASMASSRSARNVFGMTCAMNRSASGSAACAKTLRSSTTPDFMARLAWPFPQKDSAAWPPCTPTDDGRIRRPAAAIVNLRARAQ